MIELTPENDPQHAAATLTVVSKMLMTLAGREAGSLAGEAKGEAYMAALDDIPYWAVEEAARRWYRGDCGAKHDYRWPPAPAVLREIAFGEVHRFRKMMSQLNDLVRVEGVVEFSEEHCAEMRTKLVEVFRFANGQGESNGSHEQTPSDGAGAKVRSDAGEAA